MIEKSDRKRALERQIARVERRLGQLHRASDRLSNLRLVIAVIAIGVVSVLFFIPELRWLFWLSLIGFSGAFAAIVTYHRRIMRHIDEYTIWAQVKREQIARMDLDFDALPEGIPFHNPNSLEVDLDLDDLHRLINTATSRGGSQRLREWLTPNSPHQDTIIQRQRVVTELVRRTAYRDKLILHARAAAKDLRAGSEGTRLLDWLHDTEADAQHNAGRLVVILGTLSVLNITMFFLVLFGLMGDLLLTLTLMTYAIIFITQFRTIQNTFEESLTIEGALRRLSAVMHYLEQDRYAGMPHTRELARPLIEQKPSRKLRDATGVISGASLRANPIFWLLVNAIIPWDYYFAQRLARLKADLTDELPQWLDVWHDIEAMSSLANLSYLNPAYTLPRVGSDLPAIFDATQIGHPLIPDGNRVCNDFMLTDLGDIVIITGSNMSGKSSLLRALGVNLCLAYAGGVVCAAGLDTAIFRLYTSIRVTDSLDDGISYFYAEVRRLRGLLEALEAPDQPPLFFLIDEIFRGTNNRERLIGSRSYIRALADRNAVGLIATHDLELVQLEQENPRIRNIHFREDVQDGRMVFDYILREGPSPTTNALRIMMMEGLPVEEVTES